MQLALLNENLIGQVLAQTIYTIDGRPLLRAGVTLRAGYIEELYRRGYRYVYVQNMLAPDIVGESIISEELRAKALSKFIKLVHDTNKTQKLDARPLQQTVELIVAEILENKSSVRNLLALKRIENYTYEHSVDVAVLSILLGKAGYLTIDKLRILGLGAIMHDLGKIHMADLINKPGRLSPEEMETVRTHTWLGFEAMRKTPEVNLIAAHIALQHHERLDGSGYPRSLKGKEILEFAKIVAVADVYDALSTDRPYRPRLQPEEISEILKKNQGQELDANWVRLLFQHVAIYPVGSIVMLDSGEIGVVSRQTENTQKPVVRVLSDPDLNLIRPLEIVAGDEKRIKKVLNDYPRKIIEQAKRLSRAEKARLTG